MSNDVKRFIIDGRFFEGIEETEVVEASAYDEVVRESQRLRDELDSLQYLRGENEQLKADVEMAYAQLGYEDYEGEDSIADLIANYQRGRSDTFIDMLNDARCERGDAIALLPRVAEAVKTACIEEANKREQQWCKSVVERYDKGKESRMSEAGAISAAISGAVDVQAIIKQLSKGDDDD